MVTVIAQMRARAGKEEALKQVLLTLPEPTRREQGCSNYDLHQSATEPGLFAFHENWSSDADLDRHLQSSHVQAALGQLPDLLSEPPSITRWKRIA